MMNFYIFYSTFSWLIFLLLYFLHCCVPLLCLLPAPSFMLLFFITFLGTFSVALLLLFFCFCFCVCFFAFCCFCFCLLLLLCVLFFVAALLGFVFFAFVLIFFCFFFLFFFAFFLLFSNLGLDLVLFFFVDFIFLSVYRSCL